MEVYIYYMYLICKFVCVKKMKIEIQKCKFGLKLNNRTFKMCNLNTKADVPSFPGGVKFCSDWV